MLYFYYGLLFDRQEVRTALETDNYSSLQRFYMRSFDSFAELCALFKVSNIYQVKYL